MENISNIVNISDMINIFDVINISVVIRCQNPTHSITIRAIKICNNCSKFMCKSCVKKDSNICVVCSPDFDEMSICDSCYGEIVLHMCNNCGELIKFGHKIGTRVSAPCKYRLYSNGVSSCENYCELCKNCE